MSTAPVWRGYDKADEPTTEEAKMKAIVQERYGDHSVLQLRDIAAPVPAEDEVLVRVVAASVNPYDWHTMTGTPYVGRMYIGLRRPSRTIRGSDYAGVVEAVGAAVTKFKPGDEVFGRRDGAFAELLCTKESQPARKPARVSFEQAAAVPIAGLTALEALRDRGHVAAGQRVLVNGASGGVGSFAVQLAKWFGAEVTGVCSPRNVEAVGKLGANRVIDYTRTDFTREGIRYDLIVDIAGNRSIAARRRALTPRGRLVVVGGPKTGTVLGPMGSLLRVMAVSPFVGQTLIGMLAHANVDDLTLMAELMDNGVVTPLIERTYPLDEVPEAMRYLGEGHARGKLVVVI
jgi:NADPH:quinone reductase-like Zn-dependent oxidoreductase